MPTFHAEPTGGGEQERSTYVCNKRQQILRLVSRWVALYAPTLHTDPVAISFLQVPGSVAGHRGSRADPLPLAQCLLAPPRNSPTW